MLCLLHGVDITLFITPSVIGTFNTYFYLVKSKAGQKTPKQTQVILILKAIIETQGSFFLHGAINYLLKVAHTLPILGNLDKYIMHP